MRFHWQIERFKAVSCYIRTVLTKPSPSLGLWVHGHRAHCSTVTYQFIWFMLGFQGLGGVLQQSQWVITLTSDRFQTSPSLTPSKLKTEPLNYHISPRVQLGDLGGSTQLFHGLLFWSLECGIAVLIGSDEDAEDRLRLSVIMSAGIKPRLLYFTLNGTIMYKMSFRPQTAVLSNKLFYLHLSSELWGHSLIYSSFASLSVLQNRWLK